MPAVLQTGTHATPQHTSIPVFAERVCARMQKHEEVQPVHLNWSRNVTQAIARGMHAVGESVTPAGVLKYVMEGVDDILLRVMIRFFDATLSAHWEMDVIAYAPRGMVVTAADIRVRPDPAKAVPAMLSFYLGVVKATYHMRDEVIDALLDVYQHEPIHFARLAVHLKATLCGMVRNET